MILRRTSLLGLGLLATVGLSSLQAQTEERLTRPDATFPEGFALIQGVRELEDGRVMVADPLGQVVLIADMNAGTADTIGGVGQGPGEYRQPDVVFALPGDKSLLVDLGNARLTVIGPDGSFGETMPIAQGAPGPGGGLVIVLPRGVDSEGRLYFRPLGGRPGRGVPDSASVVRFDRAGGAMDTIVRVKLPDMKQSTSGGAGNQDIRISPIPLSSEDAWAVGWNGRVAVARSSDYHVEWIDPDGKVVRSEPVEYKPVKITRADKEEWAESLSNGLRIGISIENGDRRVSFGRGGGSGSPDLDSYEWPKTKPAFVTSGVWVTPEGDMWVQRSVPAGEPTQFDVFAANAQLEGKVTLPTGRDIVGFGRGTVYVIRTDDLGLQWLERYKRSAT
jgi:hypothetical protein